VLKVSKRSRQQIKSERRCLVAGCKGEVAIKDLCRKHYHAAWRETNPDHHRKWRRANVHYDRNHWRSRHQNSIMACPAPVAKGNNKLGAPAIARERRLLVRLKRKFGIPYRLPLQLQTLTPEQIVTDWKTFI